MEFGSNKSLLGYQVARALLALVATAIASVLLPQRMWFNSGVVLLMAGSVLFVSVGLVWFGAKQHVSPSVLGLVQIIGDVLFSAWVVSITGGALSAFFPLFGLSIMMVSLTGGAKDVFLSLAMSLMAFLVVIFFQKDMLPPGLMFPQSIKVVLVLVVVGLLSLLLNLRITRTEKLLASHIEMNERILTSLQAGLITTDLEHRIQTVNPFAAQILGHTQSSMQGHPVDHFLQVSKVENMRAEVVVQRGKREQMIGVSQFQLFAADQKQVGHLIMFQDMSELHKLRVRAKTKEKLEMMGELAAGLAHEIRNPLASISSSVEMVLEDKGLQDDNKHLLEIILRECDRLNGLVGTMLEFSAAERTSKSECDIKTLIQEIVALSQHEFNGHRFEVTGESIIAIVDAHQIRQVVWNLLKNAAFYGDHIQVFLSIKGEPETSSGEEINPLNEGRNSMPPGHRTIEVSVSDNGPGIPPEELSELFNLFYTKRPHGVGLGLALVKQIIDAHGGKISVQSNIGEGTTFTFELPYVGEKKPVA